MESARPIRSFLYVPGDRPDRVAKALAAGADAVLIDLEDAVAPSAKDRARAVVLDLLRSLPDGAPPVWVRINAGDTGRTDLAAIGLESHRVVGLVLAKCDSTAWLDEVAAAVAPQVFLSPLVESASAIRSLGALCDHPHVYQCHLGEIDLLADLGARPGGAAALLAHARTELVYASAAAGIMPPIGGVHPDVRDLDALSAGSAALADLGFSGRPAIHPSQVPVINTAFTPSAAEVAAAADLVARYDGALARGVGAVAADDGVMLDEAVVRRARRMLQQTQNDRREETP
jgi:citrate lyase subunit beta/citryl-CoA lyase